VAARGASAAFGGFGFALKTAATFDVFYWLQVTNYGVLYVLFDSAPSGSNYIDVWDLCLHAQTASPIISSQCLAASPGESKPKSCLIACHDACAARAIYLRLHQPLLSHDRTRLRRTDKPAMPTQRSASPARTRLRELPWFLTKRNDQAEHAHCQSINRQWVKQDMNIFRLA
jgi:hypothetical protein